MAFGCSCFCKQPRPNREQKVPPTSLGREQEGPTDQGVAGGRLSGPWSQGAASLGALESWHEGWSPFSHTASRESGWGVQSDLRLPPPLLSGALVSFSWRQMAPGQVHPWA